MKTDQAIALEIATLQALAELLPPLTDCGLQDNSRQVVAAQIDVLAHRLDTNQVHDGYMASCSDDMFLDVLHASDWLHDMLAPEYDSAPSIQWRDRVKYFDGAELVDERAQAALLAACEGYALERRNELSADIRHTLANYNAA